MFSTDIGNRGASFGLLLSSETGGARLRRRCGHSALRRPFNHPGLEGPGRSGVSVVWAQAEVVAVVAVDAVGDAAVLPRGLRVHWVFGFSPFGRRSALATPSTSAPPP